MISFDYMKKIKDGRPPIVGVSYTKPDAFASEIEASNLEPIGICKNVPFEPSYAKYSVAFCFKYKDEIYWCHMTETIWFSLLSDIYGRRKADEIISGIMGY